MSIPLSVKQFSRAGTVVEVPLASTVFSQDQLDYAKVDRMAKMKRDDLPPAFAAHVGNKVIVQDGHHRTAADIKKRRKTTSMRIF